MLRAVKINSKDGKISILHIDKPDTATCSSEDIVEYKRNLNFRTGIAAWKQANKALGDEDPQIFASAGSEYFYTDKCSFSNVKQMFDNMKKGMPLFPFAATAQVKWPLMFALSSSITPCFICSQCLTGYMQ